MHEGTPKQDMFDEFERPEGTTSQIGPLQERRETSPIAGAIRVANETQREGAGDENEARLTRYEDQGVMSHDQAEALWSGRSLGYLAFLRARDELHAKNVELRGGDVFPSETREE